MQRIHRNGGRVKSKAELNDDGEDNIVSASSVVSISDETFAIMDSESKGEPQ